MRGSNASQMRMNHTKAGRNTPASFQLGRVW